MGRPNDVAKLLQEGLSPTGIAKRLGISVGSVRQYLWVAVMERLVRRSDVLFSLPKELRVGAEKIMQSERPKTVFDLQRILQKKQILCDREELNILWNLTASRVGYGDLYEFVTGTEEILHNQIRLALKVEFGEQESGWWRKGVPENIRVACAQAREHDDDGDADPYAYTTLIHLKGILERHWPLFVSRLPKTVTIDRKSLLREIERLNAIRNRIMHPTRLHKVTDEDFEFAREMHRKLRLEAWQLAR
jgi:hypothetical protein